MKRFIAILMVAMLVLTSFATVALAAGTGDVTVGTKTIDIDDIDQYTDNNGDILVSLPVTVKGEFANYELFVVPDSELTISKISGVINNVNTGKVAFATDENVDSGTHSFTVTFKLPKKENISVGNKYNVNADVLFVADRNLKKLDVDVSNGYIEIVGSAAHVHDWSDWTVTKAPTCTEKGTETRTCSGCDEKQTRDINALGHAFSTVWSTNKTHHWYECTRENCGAKDEHGEHVFPNDWTIVKQPTTTVKGEKHRDCEVCGYRQNDDIDCLAPTPTPGPTDDVCDHEWGAWKVTKKATCTEKGVETRTCSECGEKQTREIKALGHKLTKDWQTDKDYHWHVCERCDKVFDHDEHDFPQDWHVDKKPSEAGNGVKSRTCKVCEYKQTGTIPYEPDLDDVPVTGDMTSHLVLGAVAVLGLMTAAVLVLKRKAVK